MKLLKYSFMVLALAIITSVGLCRAEDIYYKIGVYEIPVGQTVETQSVKKTREGGQIFYNEKTFTGLNNPCKSCRIRVGLIKKNEDTNKWEEIAFLESYHTNANFFVGSPSYSNGNYHLSLSRDDFTLLPTHVSWKWQFQVPLA